MLEIRAPCGGSPVSTGAAGLNTCLIPTVVQKIYRDCVMLDDQQWLGTGLSRGTAAEDARGTPNRDTHITAQI